MPRCPSRLSLWLPLASAVLTGASVNEIVRATAKSFLKASNLAVQSNFHGPIIVMKTDPDAASIGKRIVVKFEKWDHFSGEKFQES